MGIDLLDLFFRIEKTFKIKLDRVQIQELMLPMCLDVDESKVTPEAWMVADLGMQ